MPTTPVLPSTPSPKTAAEAWTKQFEEAVREAAGDSGRLTPRKAASMSGPYADNARNYFERTGRSWANADTVVDSGERYVTRAAERAAGPDKKLSLTDIRAMPKDLVDDMLLLRGKAPAAPSVPVVEPPPPAALPLADALAAINDPYFNDLGHGFGSKSYPASASREDILRDVVGHDDLSDAEVRAWFSSTAGAAGLASFVDELNNIGREVGSDSWDTGAPYEWDEIARMWQAFTASVEDAYAPSSGLRDIELATHHVAEDGDTERRVLMARRPDDSWLVVDYSHFPF